MNEQHIAGIPEAFYLSLYRSGVHIYHTRSMPYRIQFLRFFVYTHKIRRADFYSFHIISVQSLKS